MSGIDWFPSSASDWGFVGVLAVIVGGVCLLLALLWWLGTHDFRTGKPL